MMVGFVSSPNRITVPCKLDVELTAESFHAHAIPEGIELRPGDTVIIHGAPTHLQFGDCFTKECTATVFRASWLKRLWTRVAGLAEITELYEVGFMPPETL